MLPVFAYGTLRDLEYQRELFGTTYAMQAARVTGFAIRSTAGGYLAAVPNPGASIDGAVCRFDERALAIADAWEDLTVYERIVIEGLLDDGRRTACFIYVRAGVEGPPVDDGRLADRPRHEVITEIRRFRATLP